MVALNRSSLSLYNHLVCAGHQQRRSILGWTEMGIPNSSLHVNEFRVASHIHELRLTWWEQETLDWKLNFKQVIYFYGYPRTYHIREKKCQNVFLLLILTKNVYMNFSVWPRGRLREECVPFSFHGAYGTGPRSFSLEQ